MSKDIRSYFNVVSKKQSTSAKTNASPPYKKAKTAKKVIISSDEDEEVVAKTPERRKKTVDGEKKTKEIQPKKAANSNEIFPNRPIKQTKVETKRKTELKVHENKDFEKILTELDQDDDVFVDNLDVIDKTIEDALNESKIIDGAESKPTKNKRKLNHSSSGEPTPTKKPKKEDGDQSIDGGQEAYEKRRYSAMLYQQYLKRGTPKNKGKKDLPKGKSDCLKNLSFLRTGILDSLEGDDFKTLIEEHGGKVISSVSRKLNFLVVGDDPGPSKLEKAKDFNIKNICEDELLDMILIKSNMKPKYFVQKEEKMDLDDDFVEKKIIKKQTDTKTDLKKEIIVNEKTESGLKNNLEEKNKKVVEHKRNEVEKKVPKIQNLAKIPQIKINQEEVYLNGDFVNLTDKYKPKTLSEIIGQHGDGSNALKLKTWLQNWHHNQQPEVHKKLIRPSPWAKNDTGAWFKCALLSGPPGIGKTTTATLISRELNYDFVEFNASDTRNKKMLQTHIAELLSCTSLVGLIHDKTKKQRLLIMDEVDGMSGNEDRGGVQELIALIKKTSIPIICICNDRNHQKMKTLVNYCFDLKFQKPKPQQILGAMSSVCYKEKIAIKSDALLEIIKSADSDIRQILNNLNMWRTVGDKQTITKEGVERVSEQSKKDDPALGPWEVCRKVFEKDLGKPFNITEKSRLFFSDYSIGPLFVQENYLKTKPDSSKTNCLKRAALAADYISMGDIFDGVIRGQNNWSLLDAQGMFSSVFPGYLMAGPFQGQINFPQWLGKYSKGNKFKRIFSELQMHMQMTTGSNKNAIKYDYLIPIRDSILLPLKNEGQNGIQKSIDFMKTYNLLREDLEGINEISTLLSKNSNNPMNGIDTKVKTAFTRLYNKQTVILPYTKNSSKKSATSSDKNLEDDDVWQENENIESSESEDDEKSIAKFKKNTTSSKSAKNSSTKKTEKAVPKKGKK